ncbi:transcriptional regulator, partial [Pseudomonas syringae pv. tagetis]
MPNDLYDILKALAHPVSREILTWLKYTRASFPAKEYSNEHGESAGQN